MDAAAKAPWVGVGGVVLVLVVVGRREGGELEEAAEAVRRVEGGGEDEHEAARGLLAVGGGGGVQCVELPTCACVCCFVCEWMWIWMDWVGGLIRTVSTLCWCIVYTQTPRSIKPTVSAALQAPIHSTKHTYRLDPSHHLPPQQRQEHERLLSRVAHQVLLPQARGRRDRRPLGGQRGVLLLLTTSLLLLVLVLVEGRRME